MSEKLIGVEYVEYLEAKIKKLESDLQKANNIIEYLESFIEFCDCKNPKEDCICIDKNGYKDSKDYKCKKLEKQNKIMREALEYYADMPTQYMVLMNLDVNEKARKALKEIDNE